jgi:hypothetical protein
MTLFSVYQVNNYHSTRKCFADHVVTEPKPEADAHGH